MSKEKPKIRKRGPYWQVDFGETKLPGGTVRRERRSFKTRAEAQEELNARGFESKNKRVRLLDLTDTQRQDILGGLRILDGKAGVTEAATFFMKHGRPDDGPRTLADVTSEYLEGKQRAGRRPKTIIDARSKCECFVRSIDRTYVHEVMTADVEKWLNTQGFTPATWDSYRRAVVGLFNYATKRKYIPENPALAIESVEFDQAVPEVMDVTDVRKILRAAEKHSPDLVPHLAIGFFAGLRSAELEGLQWEQIDLSESLITVTPETAKKRRMRHVEIAENLSTWLAPYRKPSGPVHYSRRQLRRIRDFAGVEWPHNAMRHSFASYALVDTQDAAKVSLMLGHQRADVLFSNYRNIRTLAGRNVTGKLAAEYWEIRPRKTADNIIQLAAQQKSVSG